MYYLGGGIIMKDFRKTINSISKDSSYRQSVYSSNEDKQSLDEKKDASPLSNALFLHFQKWNPELIPKGIAEINEG